MAGPDIDSEAKDGSLGEAAWHAVCRSQFVIELSPDGTVLDVNGKLACALGQPRAAMIGRPHRSFIARREGAADADPEAPHRVIAYRTADGGELLVQATTSPILDSSGVPIRALVIGVDVTDRCELRAALGRAEAEARARTELLAATSHGMRTPMAGVLGFAELLLGGDLAPDQRRRAEMILDAGRSMVTLLGSVLDMARYEAGAGDIAAEPVDLVDRLAACAELVRPLAARRGVTVRCDVAPELPQWIACDAQRLRQMVLNMLSAAIEPSSGGVVALAAEPAWDDPHVVAISVSGSSAAPVEAPRLGMTIASELARSMGGSLTCAGTRAELRLPLRPADGRETHPQIYPMSVARDRRHDRPRVLVADDDLVSRALALDQLARVGARADVASNGAVALAMVAEAEAAGDPYRLVLMDRRMPVMDGLDATRRLRANGHTAARLPVIALTAGGLADERETNLAAGMQDTLVKPVELAALAHAIDRWAPERRRYRRADMREGGGYPVIARG